MKRINQDTIVAIFLLLFCAVFIGASFQIREMDFGQMSSSTWPRVILALLTLLVLVYLVQSITRPPAPGRDDAGSSVSVSSSARKPGIGGWFAYYRNALWCYALFFAFLFTLDVLGMLIGGILFVFGMLTVLGERTPRHMVMHAAIAVISVGLMWSIFTFGLRVILPQGMILTVL